MSSISLVLIGRDCVKRNGTWAIGARWGAGGETRGRPGDPDAPPSERFVTHMSDAADALAAGAWETAVDNALAASGLRWATTQPNGGSYGAPDDIFVSVLRQFGITAKPDGPLINAAGKASLALSSQHSRARELNLAAIKHAMANPQADVAAASFAKSLAATGGTKDADVISALRDYVQGTMVRGPIAGDGSRAAVAALATVDSQEWSHFASFDPGAVIKGFREVWYSGNKAPRDDLVDRNSDCVPVMNALFAKLGSIDIFGKGRGGLSLPDNYTLWLKGPRNASVRGAVADREANNVGSYTLDLQPGVNGRWIIVGIHDVVLNGDAVTAVAATPTPSATPTSIRTPTPDPVPDVAKGSGDPQLSQRGGGGTLPGPATSPSRDQVSTPIQPAPLPDPAKQASEGAAAYEQAGKVLNAGGANKDWRGAIELYRKAATLGHARANVQMGVCYAKGLGVTKDNTQAVAFFQNAADMDDALGLGWLAHAYEDGLGVASDGAKALQLFQRSANKGNKEAVFSIGHIYWEGKVVPKDVAKAMTWYRKSAEQGFAPGENALGQILYGGANGVVTRDRAEGLMWLKKAADAGDADAKGYMAKRNLK